MATEVSGQMTDQRRALLTEREREILSRDADVTDNYRYSVESRIRTRLKERLGGDVDVIRENYPEMYDDLVYPVVCGAGPLEGRAPRDDDTAGGEPDGGLEGGASDRVSDDVSRRDSSVPVDPEQRMRDVLGDLDVVGRGAETKEVRREAIAFAWELLRDAGDATTQELANAAFDEYADHPKLGYSASENHYRGYTFWDSCARDALKQLPGVDAPAQRGNTWRFVGGDDDT